MNLAFANNKRNSAVYFDAENRSSAEQYLNCLDKGRETWTFQTFDDNTDRRDRSLTRVFHGSLESNFKKLQALNEKGAGVFVCVNRTNGKGRKAADITGIRCVWIEDDVGEATPITTPSLTVESSPNKYHHYFFLEEANLSEFTELQGMMVQHCGSDPNAKDVSRVLRLPGFYHQKISTTKNLTGEPHLVRVIEPTSGSRREFSTSELLAKFPALDEGGWALGKVPEYLRVSRQHYGTDNPFAAALNDYAIKYPESQYNKAELKAMLLHISPEIGRDEWRGVVWSVQSLGWECSERAARQWSCGRLHGTPCEKYDVSSFRVLINDFDVGGGVTFGTLMHHAKAGGYKGKGLLLKDVPVERVSTDSPLSKLLEYEPSDKQINTLANPEWIYKNLLIRSHVVAIPAPPNAGKTTIFEAVASWVSNGNRVIYLNADISGGEIKRAKSASDKGGYHLLTPDLKEGGSMEEITKLLNKMSHSGESLSDIVLIVDTLKKMVDVISKSASSRLFKLFRRLSAKGMTIVLLAHTNKYTGEDGKLIYEGTGDLRADVDELIYLVHQKRPDGSIVVTTEPDKVRGSFKPISFEISPNREVSQCNYVDTHAENRFGEQLAKDMDDVVVIDMALAEGPMNQSQIIQYCKANDVSRRRTLDLLKRYSEAPHLRWAVKIIKENNTRLYSLPESHEG